MAKSNTPNSKRIKILLPILFLVLMGVIACGMYLRDYYHADMERIDSFSVEHAIEIQTDTDGNLVFHPEEPIAGLIFYPGGKVEHTAYVPLMKALAAEGIFGVLVEIPFRLAVFDIHAADGIREQYPEIENWYIGGHSLGGSMAASYLEKHSEEYDGLILFGSYAATDLSQTDLSVISIYGSEDMVLNREKYEENTVNLPNDFTEVVIDGGCHAYFGMYGAQEGDGVPAISNEEQIAQTVDVIVGNLVRFQRSMKRYRFVRKLTL